MPLSQRHLHMTTNSSIERDLSTMISPLIGLITSPSDWLWPVVLKKLLHDSTGCPSFEFVIENRFVRLCIGGTELYRTLYGRTFNLRVKSKYVGLNNRNKDHFLQLSLMCVCTQFGGHWR